MLAPAFRNFVPCTPSLAEVEQHKLDRLRELRATIDALRTEQTSRDPLLNWIIEQNHSQRF